MPAEDESFQLPAGDEFALAVALARDADAQRLRRLLGPSERPLVVAGMGIRMDNADILRAWLDRWQLPVAVTPKVKGIVDETAPNFVGTVGGMAIDSVLRDALASADLVIGFGLDPAEIDGAWHTELPIVWPLESAWATGVVPTRGLLAADHGELLRSSTPIRRACGQTLRANAPDPSRDLCEPHGHSGQLSPVAVVRTLAGVLPPETIVVTDVGSHKYLFGQFWPSSEPETFFMSNGLSGMGYGLPAAIGAKLARPESPVLAVLGDGGFSMNSQELETAQRLGAPFVTVVLVDGSYSLIRIGQENRGLTRYGVDFDPIDSVKTAEACGVPGVRVTSESELAAAVAAAVATRTPLLVEVPIDAADYDGIV